MDGLAEGDSFREEGVPSIEGVAVRGSGSFETFRDKAVEVLGKSSDGEVVSLPPTTLSIFLISVTALSFLFLTI